MTIYIKNINFESVFLKINYYKNMYIEKVYISNIDTLKFL